MKLAMEIAEREEKRGHRGAAQALRGSINPNGRRANGFEQAHAPVPMNSLIEESRGPLLDEVVLKPSARKLLREVVLEWRARGDLRSAGIRRRNSLLFWGPPGCGKTLTARALGRELGLPVFTVRLSSVVGSYLGQTGASLRSLFLFAQTTPCVFLLDEIDALGRTRGRSHDVGELDRVVISLLQELDHSEPAGLVVAATNLEKAIDPALWRRFSVNLRFPAPASRDLKAFARRRLVASALPATRTAVDRLSRLQTFAAVEAAIEDLRRDRVLSRARRES